MRILLSKPHLSGRESARIEEALASGFVAPAGPQLDAFEAEMARYLGGDVHCVAVSSGTAALHLGLRLVGVGRGDRVIVSSMTFAGGVFPVTYLGATPVFVDLDPATWTVDVAHVEEAIRSLRSRGERIGAIVPTDLYGQSVDLTGLEDLARTHDIPLVVDSAESLGSRGPGGIPCGRGGDVAILSFNGNKIITTSGGGMLVTGDADLAARTRHLATQAREPAPHYEHVTVGYNYRLSNISAAIGLAQLEVLDDRVAARRAIFQRYDTALSPLGVEFMPEPEGYRSSRWLTAARFDERRIGVGRERVRLGLLEEGIESRPLWKPMHLQPVFDGTRYFGRGVDERLFREGLCLPSGSDMTEEEQADVIAAITSIVG